jgi:hypothetical protein
MNLLVAPRAYSDQIPFLVRAALASKLDVVNLEVPWSPTDLAFPTVALQNASVKLAVCADIKSYRRAPFKSLHDARSLIEDKKLPC